MNLADTISFSAEINDKIPGLQLGILEVNRFTVTKKSETVDKAFYDLYSYIENKFAEEPPSSNNTVSAVRRMYRRIGWEPTRYRPSSEAMIRRIIKRKGLYRINNAVDLGNVASTRYHLPMGLYDMNKIDGNIKVDVGKEDEAYKGLSISLIHAHGKLILRDGLGIFGNPTADSKRTSITESTDNLLAIFFTPPEISRSYLNQTLDYLKTLYSQEASQTRIDSFIVSS